MRILITNDDGIHAPGLLALRAALAPLGDVTAIAPERPRSACGHAITLHKPLRLTPVKMPDGGEGFASNGTPADCIALGTSKHLGWSPDLVAAGINPGPNLGIDMIYSGTVAAATEAAICGLPSFAISVVSVGHTGFEAASEFATLLARTVLDRKLPEGCFLNVNVPGLPRDQIAGVAFTRQGRVRYSSRVERRTDPRGGAYYWLTGELLDHHEGPGSDIEAVSRNMISITPVKLDFTDHSLVSGLAAWEFEWPPRQ